MMENYRATFFILTHQTRILEMRNQVIMALNSGIGDFAHLLAVEFIPFFPVEMGVQGNDMDRIGHVNERIPHIAFVLKINRQIKKLVTAFQMDVDARQQHFLSVFVGNVPQHHRCAFV